MKKLSLLVLSVITLSGSICFADQEEREFQRRQEERLQEMNHRISQIEWDLQRQQQQDRFEQEERINRQRANEAGRRAEVYIIPGIGGDDGWGR